jgi:hypothetical protein
MGDEAPFSREQLKEARSCLAALKSRSRRNRSRNRTGPSLLLEVLQDVDEKGPISIPV